MASNAELQTRIDELEAENDDLAAQLEEAEKRAKVLPNTNPQPTEPSFKLTEGNRDELERLGRTISPFTGARLIGTPDSYREVTEAEFVKHVKDNPV